MVALPATPSHSLRQIPGRSEAGQLCLFLPSTPSHSTVGSHHLYQPSEAADCYPYSPQNLGALPKTSWPGVQGWGHGNTSKVPRASSALVLRALPVGLPPKQLPEPCVFAQASGGRSLTCLSLLSTWDQR